MMRQLFWSILVGLLIFGNPAGTHARFERKPIFYANSGPSFSFAPSDLERFWKKGYSLGAGLGVPLDREGRFTAQGYFIYNQMLFDSSKFLDPISGQGGFVSGENVSIWTFTVNLKARIGLTESRFRPYFIGGGGFFSISSGDITVPRAQRGLISLADTDSETAVGIGFGLGMDIGLTRNVNLFFEGKGGIGNTESFKVIYLPVKIGLSFQSR